LNQEEAALWQCLDVYPRVIDEISRESGFTPQKTNELLLLLELKGIVKALPGKYFQRAASLSGE
jgi:DNA processing protein